MSAEARSISVKRGVQVFLYCLRREFRASQFWDWTVANRCIWQGARGKLISSLVHRSDILARSPCYTGIAGCRISPYSQQVAHSTNADIFRERSYALIMSAEPSRRFIDNDQFKVGESLRQDALNCLDKEFRRSLNTGMITDTSGIYRSSTASSIGLAGCAVTPGAAGFDSATSGGTSATGAAWSLPIADAFQQASAVYRPDQPSSHLSSTRSASKCRGAPSGVLSASSASSRDAPVHEQVQSLLRCLAPQQLKRASSCPSLTKATAMFPDWR